MGIALLLFASLLFIGVATSYRPIRTEPISTPAFLTGWLISELGSQHSVSTAAVTVLLVHVGALHSVLGKIGLGLMLLNWVGLLAHVGFGRRARGVVRSSLQETPNFPIALLPDHLSMRWHRWWRSAIGIPVKGFKVKVTKNIDYFGDGRHAHHLDVITDARGAKDAPVMVYIHGGAWVIGDKREQALPMLYELARRGWVCVSVNYRLSPKGTWPEHIIDVKHALAWVRREISAYGGDASFLALSGGSAGGHLAALTALTVGDEEFGGGNDEARDVEVDACIPFYGTHDMEGHPDLSGRFGRGLVTLLEEQVMKLTVLDNPEVFKKASPLRQVRADAPPFYVIQGAHDTLIPVIVARRFVADLRKAGAPIVAYSEFPLAQHAFDTTASPRSAASTAGVLAFLDAVMAQKQAKAELSI
ncbi:MAG: alpha/beta hydrolase [Actinobacteria bacterium]|nr:alpha/beta hydrolase [Actinomycetota bacterium]